MYRPFGSLRGWPIFFSGGGGGDGVGNNLLHLLLPPPFPPPPGFGSGVGNGMGNRSCATSAFKARIFVLVATLRMLALLLAFGVGERSSAPSVAEPVKAGRFLPSAPALPPQVMKIKAGFLTLSSQ